MPHSTFRLPGHLAADLASGYQYKNGTYQPVPFTYANLAPATGVSTTATDIAHFMIAHLQNGRYSNTRILEEATAIEMHRQHFTQHPRLNGFAYDFWELFYN